MDVIEYVNKSFGLYFGDKESYSYIDKNTTWQSAFFVSVGFSFLVSLIAIFVEYTYTTNPNFLIENFISLLIATLILLPITIFVMYGLIYFILKLFGGKADYFNTLRFGVSISMFTTLLIGLFNMIPSRFFNTELNYTLDLIYVVIVLVIVIWAYVVHIRVYSRLHDLSEGKTAIALLIPLLIMFVIALIIFFLFFLFLGASF